MELLIKNSPNAGYVTNDVVYIAPDNHSWGSGELDTNVFTIVKNVAITQYEKELLLMLDEQVIIPKSALKVHALRKAMINRENMKYQSRRRYKYTNQMERK